MNCRKIISVLLACAMIAASTGCNKRTELIETMNTSMQNKVDIQLSIEPAVSTIEREALSWQPIDQLKTYENIRDTFDDKMNIIKFGQGSKNGCIYVDKEGNWTGNTVLFYAFRNKEFVKKYWENNKIKGAIGQTAAEQFSDITKETTGIYAAYNAYYNIMPANADGTSGLSNYISRKEAMLMLYRADTPVTELEENLTYNEKLGADACNKYTCNVEDNSFFKVENGSLNKYTYNAAISRAEALHLIVTRYFKDEYDSVDVNAESPFTDCKNGGNVLAKYEMENGHAWQTYSLEISLQNPDVGVDEALYRALVVAYNHGMVNTTTNWNTSIMEGEFFTMLIKAYTTMFGESNYPVNAMTGYNEGNGIEEIKPEDTEETLDGVDGADGNDDDFFFGTDF